MKRYTYVDLFCGAGGLSLGFDQASFVNVFSVEYDKDFAKIYKHNLNHNVIIDDIKNITETDIKTLIQNKTIDVVIGGPPCQGFSIAGNIARNFIEDPRNILFKEFVRFVKIIKPKFFLMENVANIATHNKGKTLKEIEKEFESLGYSLKSKVVNTKFYSIPQERRRFIMVGSLNSNKFDFPIEEQRILTIKDAIDDLPALNSGEKSDIPNHEAMKHTSKMLEKMSYIKDGGNRNDMPEFLRPKSGDPRKYIRYNSSKPAYCVTGDMRKIFHYNQNRALTNRELARLQTFPDDFIFIGNSGKIQQAIGNAVPPRLAFLLAEKFREALDNE
jgi:DNA (cytosine-5)-methyltransferase 1